MAKPEQMEKVVAFSPGRVNLIGEHTDYCGGVALPIAIQFGVRARLCPGPGAGLEVSSSTFAGTFYLGRQDGSSSQETGADGTPWPSWGRYVSATVGVEPILSVPAGRLEISADLPAGAGLSSSAALCVAVALALGAPRDADALARREQAAEALAGIEVGLLDPLAITAARAGHALLIDFASGERLPVAVPDGMEVVVVHSGVDRDLVTSPYATRRNECAAAERIVGLLGAATVGDLGAINDPIVRRRAHHIVTECGRVHEMVTAFGAGDVHAAGRLLLDGHRSMRDDFQLSTPAVDGLVDLLAGMPGVHGARMTGGGFGGCVVAFAEPGAIDVGAWPGKAWTMTPSAGARLLSEPDQPSA